MLPWVRHDWLGAELVIMHKIAGLREIAQNFDAMLIDQFGVIHDGHKLYAGALEAMQHLHDLSIPVIIMTNSGKRAKANVSRIISMGLPRDYFVDCVSSGEVAYQSLDVSRAFLIGKQGEDYGFDPIQFVGADQAEVILILGSNAPTTSLGAYARLFRGLSLPAICCNPDKLMITPNGLQPAPGAIAEIYENQGGPVTWIGKPYAEIYEFALAKLGNPKRVLCIGDSAEHDVAGGRGAGLTTLLVQQGISADMAEAELHPQPDFLLPSFCWK
jgi:HAD superfamily hydrolase (TIGR01459 family)